MPYIGNTAGNRFVASKAATQFSGDGSETVFTLDHSVGSDEDILVSVDGVIQEPSVAYAVSNGTTLTFTAAPSSNSGNNIFVYYLFRTVGTVDHPSTSALSATSGTFSGDVTIPDKIIHSGDTDTFINFSDANEVKIETGGVEIAKFSSGATVFNNGGADMDTRFEGDTDTGLLFLDAGSNQVCMGTTTTIANTKLNVSGPIKGTFAGGDAPTTGTMNQLVEGGNNTYGTLFHNTASTPNSQYIIEIRFKNSSPDNANAKFIECRDSTTNRFMVNSDGDVKNHDNSYGAISDVKLKEQISDATSQWDDIKALTIRKFKFKTDVATGDSDAHWRLGVIAQEVETAGMNGLVTDEDDTEEKDGVITSKGTTTKTVKYSILYMKAVKALQEAMARIETLEAKVKTLESK